MHNKDCKKQTAQTVLKIIFNKPRLHPTTLLYANNKILNLRNLYVYSSLSYLPKIKDAFHTISHSHQTRANLIKNVYLPLLHSSVCQRFLIYNIPKIYNILPIYIRNKILQNKIFKRELRLFIVDNQHIFIPIFTL